MELQKNWQKREPSLGGDMGMLLPDEETGVYLSYQPNETVTRFAGASGLDSANPETAIVIKNDKPDGHNRYLIYRGDWRAELEKLFPDLDALKKHWKEHGGHFFSDSPEDEDNE